MMVGAGSLTAQDDCKLVLDATIKAFDVPVHAYVTMNISGKPETGESIYAGGVVYAKYNGKWSTGFRSGSTATISGSRFRFWEVVAITCEARIADVARVFATTLMVAPKRGG